MIGTAEPFAVKSIHRHLVWQGSVRRSIAEGVARYFPSAKICSFKVLDHKVWTIGSQSGVAPSVWHYWH